MAARVDRRHEALAGVRVTAVFGDQNRVAGSGGCYRYATAQMYCGATGVMSQERAYLSALEGATAYRVMGSELHLGPARGAVTLVFKVDTGAE